MKKFLPYPPNSSRNLPDFSQDQRPEELDGTQSGGTCTSMKKLFERVLKLTHQPQFGKDHSGFHVEWVLHKAVLVVNDFDLVQKLLGLEITIKKTTRKGDETLPVLKKLFGKGTRTCDSTVQSNTLHPLGLFMIRSHEWKRQHRVATRGMGSKHIKAYTPVVIEVIKRVHNSLQLNLPITLRVAPLRLYKILRKNWRARMR
eukprot:1380005-Amorphochlora_amoeboformis.AAC.2